MTDQNMNDVTPDTLMERFKGRGLKSIILFTVVVHIVVIVGSSVPYLVKTVFGANTAGMTQEERVKAAVKDATEAIRDIAAEYELNPQEISDQFAGGGARASAVAAEGADAAAPETGGAPEAVPGEDAEGQTERPKSQIEKDLEATADGPAVPSMDDDIF